MIGGASGRPVYPVTPNPRITLGSHGNPAGSVTALWHVAGQRVVSADGRLAVVGVMGRIDRHSLFLCSAATTVAQLARVPSRGLIHRLRVDVPEAGRP